MDKIGPNCFIIKKVDRATKGCKVDRAVKLNGLT